MRVHATVTRILAYPIDQVWALLEDFGNIHWAPGIDKLEVIGEGLGMIRRIHIDGLNEPIDEVLHSIDANNFTFSYTIPRGLPFPLKDYKATSSSKALADDKTEVTWRSDCAPDGLSLEDSTAMLEGTYNQLLDWISEELARRHETA